MLAAPPDRFYASLRLWQGFQQLTWATALAQRAAPNFLLFDELTHGQQGPPFAHLLTLLWEGLTTPQARINWPVQQEKIAPLLPDRQAHDLYGVYPALDAVTALELALDEAVTLNPETAVDASKLSRATVRHYLEQLCPEGMSLDEAKQWIRHHPLMEDEQAFQDELFAQVQQLKKPYSSRVRAIKILALNQGVSNLGISLA